MFLFIMAMDPRPISEVPEYLRGVTLDLQPVPISSQPYRFIEVDALMARINDMLPDENPCVLREIESGSPEVQLYDMVQYGLKRPRGRIAMKRWVEGEVEHETIDILVERPFQHAEGTTIGCIPGGTVIGFRVEKNGTYNFHRDHHTYPFVDKIIKNKLLLQPEIRSECSAANTTYGRN
jgi:hypothetical protein